MGRSYNEDLSSSSDDEYLNLLAAAQTEHVNYLRTAAAKYVPQMYTALRRKGLTPKAARDRIEEDCDSMWSKRTILAALPDEAKDVERQNAGRSKKRKQISDNCAAESAANPKAMVICTGESTDHTEFDQLDSMSNPSQTTHPTDIHLTEKDDGKELECQGCNRREAEILELRRRIDGQLKALQSMGNGNQVREEYLIPKSLQDETLFQMRRSREVCYLRFDNRDGLLRDVEADTIREERRTFERG